MTDPANKPAVKKNREPFELEDSLRAWAETARDVLVDLMQIDEETASRLAREIVVRFAEDHAGEAVYFAKGKGYQLDVRDLEIYAAFNGRNWQQVARQFKVTPRHVRRLIKRAEIVNKMMTRDDLFPESLDIPDRH
jgi:Mor family transcriptional regulator